MASLFKRGDIYWLQWYEDNLRKRRSLHTSDKEKAEITKTAKELQLKTGVNVLKRLTSSSFSVFAEQYVDWHKYEYPDSHQRVAQIIEDHLTPVFGTMELKDITPQLVENYKHERRKVAAVATVNKELRTLNAVIHRAVAWGKLSGNPIKSVKAIRDNESAPHNYFTVDQLEDIYEISPEYAALWKLLANTGMRRGEAMALTWDNVLDTKIRIISTAKNRTKSGKWREVPISPGCCNALNTLWKNATGEYVFPRIDKDSLSRAFRMALKRTNNRGTLHDLRHTFISHLVMKGVPLRTVQVLAGHATIKTTEGYAHLAPDHLRDSVAGLTL